MGIFCLQATQRVVRIVGIGVLLAGVSWWSLIKLRSSSWILVRIENVRYVRCFTGADASWFVAKAAVCAYPYAHFLDRCSPGSCGARRVTSRSTSCRNAFAERATGPRNRSASARKEAVDQHDQNAGLMWVKNPGSRAQTRRHRNSVSFRPRAQASDAPGTISPHTQGARPVVMAGFPWRHTDASMPPWGIVCSKSGSRQADMGVAGTKRR